MKGFTLLEIIVVFAILLIVGSGAIFLLRNQLLGNLEGDAEVIASRLQEAQARASSGVDQLEWGIHFDAATSSPFYAMFSGGGFATTTNSTTFYLSTIVEFEDPTQGFSKDILFQRLTGTISSSTSVTIRLKTNTADRRSISVSKEGKISVSAP